MNAASKIAKLLLLLLLPSAALAQNSKVTGAIVNASSGQALPGANIILTSMTDSTQKQFTISDIKGHFTINNVVPRTYRVEISFIGYNPQFKKVNISGTEFTLGTIRLSEKSELIGGATINGVAVRASVKGDTTIYSADSYKVAKDADAETLIAKMPGITTSNGTITAQGEKVQKVLVDGKPFFGEDPTVAVRSLPAEIIDKIQVFDKLSDQAEFTGFDDGNSVKAINVITKQNKRTGQFGKMYAGYGTDNRYSVGGNVNIFNGDARTSIIGMSNNVNQQNFSTEDILGVLGQSGGRGGMRGMGGGHGGGPGGGGISNYTIPQQSGISKTSALGINFSDKLGSKVNFSGSYFFNYGNTTNEQKTNRQYFGAIDTAQRYAQSSLYGNTTYNNRVNMKVEYAIDSKNSMIFTPNFSYQSTRTSSSSFAQTTLGPTSLLNKSDNISNSLSEGYNFSNDILFRHKFDKNGRTFSVGFGTNYAYKTGSSDLNAKNIYKTTAKNVEDTISQNAMLKNTSYGFTGTAIYTEPIGSKSQLMVNYNVGYTKNDNDKRTYALDSKSYQQMVMDTLLSNVYQNDYLTQRLGLGLRLRGTKATAMINLMGQSASLDGDETFPLTYNLKRNYTNVLPMAMFNYRFNMANSLRIMYYTRTQAPSLSQLQSVVDNSDPLNLYAGNPNLNQSYTNSINLRYSFTSMDRGQTFFVFANAQNTNGYIANSTILANKETTLPNGTVLKKGATYTSPVNMNGNWSVSSMVNYGFPFMLIGSNVNISLGTGYTRLPGILNNEKIETKTYSPNGGVVIGSNFSTSFDFSLSYNAAYNFVENSASNAANSNYLSQNVRFRLNWVIANRISILPDASYQRYSGTGFMEDNFLVNFNVGVKMFKNRMGELRVGVYDLLNQNQSFSRNVNSLYVEDSYNSVLKRYVMVSFIFNLNNFKIGGKTAS